MRKINLFLIHISFIITLFSCSDPQGPMGPAGIQGPAGPQGIPGTNINASIFDFQATFSPLIQRYTYTLPIALGQYDIVLAYIHGNRQGVLDSSNPYSSIRALPTQNLYDLDGNLISPSSMDWEYYPATSQILFYADASAKSNFKSNSTFAFRIVLIKGQKGGRIANLTGIDYSDYKSVKKYFNLKKG